MRTATPGTDAVQAAVGALFAAGRAGDRAGWSARVSTRDPAFAVRAQTLFDNLRGLALRRLDARLTGAEEPLSAARRQLLGADAEVRQATLTWQLPGETGSAQEAVWLTLVPDAGGVALAGTSDGSGPDTPAQPIWWLGPVTAVTRGPVTLLLGGGQRSARWTDLTVGSVQAARRMLPEPLAQGWDGRVVVEVPSSPDDFATVLGAAPATYATTAAVTRPEGPTTAAATRIVVNPALGREDQTDRRLTLTHETVHVATRSGSSPAPLWAVEGLAEYVAYEAQPQAQDDVERTLASALREHGVPARLPDDAAFGAGASEVTVAYAEAWTACRTIAHDHSRDALGRFYARLDAGAGVPAAARDALGTDEASVVTSWRAALQRVAARG